MKKPYHAIAFVPMKRTPKERRFYLEALAPTKEGARDAVNERVDYKCRGWRWYYRRGWMQQENNGPIVSCPMCNEDGKHPRS